MMTFLNSETACSKSCEETANLLNSDVKYGLNEVDIIERRKLYSYNEFDIKNEEPIWLKYLEKVNKIIFLIFSTFLGKFF